jgi:hypothetical protein
VACLETFELPTFWFMETPKEMGKAGVLMKSAVLLSVLLASPCWSHELQSYQPDESPSFVTEGTIEAPLAQVWKVWST